MSLIVMLSSYLLAEENKILELAKMAIENKEYERAINLYKKAIEEGYNRPLITFNIGNIYYRMGNMGMAIASYEEVIQLAPHFKDSYLNLGKIYYKGQEYSNALLAFQKLLVKAPNNVELILLIGDTYKQLNMIVEAEKS